MTAGAQSIKVTDPAGVVIGSYASLAVNPAPADHLLITAVPTAVSGMPFDVALTALDLLASPQALQEAKADFIKGG